MIDSENRTLSSLYRLHRTSIFRFIRGRLRNREKAEELTQDVFLKMIGLMERSEVKNHKAALFTIANNLLIDTFRGEQVRRKIISEWDDESAEVAGTSNSMESRLDNQRIVNWLCEAILALPERCQEAFILRKIDGLSYKEIAASMNLSVKTVEKHLARALLECKKYLNAKENNVHSLEQVRRKKITHY